MCITFRCTKSGEMDDCQHCAASGQMGKLLRCLLHLLVWHLARVQRFAKNLCALIIIGSRGIV